MRASYGYHFLPRANVSIKRVNEQPIKAAAIPIADHIRPLGNRSAQHNKTRIGRIN